MPTSSDISLPLLPYQTYHLYNRGNEKRPIFYQEDNFPYFLKRYQDYVTGYLDTYAYCLLDNHFHFCVRIKSAEEILSSARADKNFNLDKNFIRRYVVPNLNTIYNATTVVPRNPNSTKLIDLLKLLPTVKARHTFNISQPFAQLPLEYDFDVHPNSLDGLSFKAQLCSYIVSQKIRRFLLSYVKSLNKQQNRTGSLFQKVFRRKHIGSIDDLKSVITYIHHNVMHHGYDDRYDRYPWCSYREYLDYKDSPIICKESLLLFGNKVEFIKYSKEYHLNYLQ